MSENLANLLEETILFVFAGIIFEVLYLEVLPQAFVSLHFSLSYALFFWGLLIMIIVAIGIGDLKYVMKRGFPFALGVTFFAYYTKDWYSLFIAIAGLGLSVILKRYANLF